MRWCREDKLWAEMEQIFLANGVQLFHLGWCLLQGRVNEKLKLLLEKQAGGDSGAPQSCTPQTTGHSPH